jgi:transposase-like protein
MANGRSAERERYWRGVIKKQRASGLSVAEFCRRNDVADALFYRWRRRLAELDAQQDSGPMAADRINEADRQAAARFVPIQLPSPPVPAGFEIVRADGLRVLVPAAFEGEALRELLRALEEVPGC